MSLLASACGSVNNPKLSSSPRPMYAPAQACGPRLQSCPNFCSKARCRKTTSHTKYDETTESAGVILFSSFPTKRIRVTEATFLLSSSLDKCDPLGPWDHNR
jgi:hypothetical protein